MTYNLSLLKLQLRRAKTQDRAKLEKALAKAAERFKDDAERKKRRPGKVVSTQKELEPDTKRRFSL